MSKGFFLIDTKYVIRTELNGAALMGVLSLALRDLEEHNAPMLAQSLCNVLADEYGETRPEIDTFDASFNPYPFPWTEIDFRTNRIYIDEKLLTFDDVRAFSETS